MGVDTNLFDVLNVSPSAEKADVDGAYALLKKIDPTNESFRLAWKILRDDNYRALYKKTSSLDDMYKSGFFDDKQDDDALWVNEDPRFICTPYHKIVERLPALSDSRSGVVLITTGSFSPLHNGHIEMLTLAKNSIEQQGECVLGGYIVPSHDSYVATKNNEEA